MKIYDIAPKPHLKLRILANLIDYGIYMVLFCVYTYTVGEETEPSKWTVNGLAAAPLFIFWFIYFVGLEVLNQATPGHDILKLKVIKVDGHRVGFLDVFKRRICDLLEIGMWGLPAIILILKTEKHQRVGDFLAGTLIVNKADVVEREISFR